MRVEWRDIAKATAARFIADQAGMRALNEAVSGLARDPEPAEAVVHGAYRRLRVGRYRLLYEVEDEAIVIVRVDRVT